jgi:hypothetical protein
MKGFQFHFIVAEIIESFLHITDHLAQLVVDIKRRVQIEPWQMIHTYNLSKENQKQANEKVMETKSNKTAFT